MFKKLASLTVLATLFFAGFAFAALDGSAHDFSDQTGATDSWNNSGEQCVVCHTTHNTDTTVAEAPLWNHEVSSGQTYLPYVGFDMDAVTGDPDGISLLCMSCHDGSVALDSYGRPPAVGTVFINTVNSAAFVGLDLRDDHPVSIIYNDALAGTDGGLFLPTATPAAAALLDVNSKVQCSSCHDVHDAGNDSLLVMPNTGSALCNTCHNK